MQAKTGHETPGNVKRLRNDQWTREIIKAGREFRLESINTNQVARVNKATIRSELSSMRWHTEMPADQEKAGETPHTLHERRPQNNKDTTKYSNCLYTTGRTTTREFEWRRTRNRTKRSDRLVRDTRTNITRDTNSKPRSFFRHLLQRRGVPEGNDVHHTKRTSGKDAPS